MTTAPRPLYEVWGCHLTLWTGTPSSWAILLTRSSRQPEFSLMLLHERCLRGTFTLAPLWKAGEGFFFKRSTALLTCPPPHAKEKPGLQRRAIVGWGVGWGVMETIWQFFVWRDEAFLPTRHPQAICMPLKKACLAWTTSMPRKVEKLSDGYGYITIERCCSDLSCEGIDIIVSRRASWFLGLCSIVPLLSIFLSSSKRTTCLVLTSLVFEFFSLCPFASGA